MGTVLTLAFFTPGGFLTWKALRRLAGARQVVFLVAAAVIGAISLTTLAVALTARLVGLDAGMAAAFMLLLAAALVAHSRLSHSSRPCPALRMPAGRERILLEAVFILLAVVVSLIAFTTYFHDEIPVNGHLAIANSIARGNFPPRMISMPEFPLAYHYGYDLVVAMVLKLTGADAWHVSDVLTVVLYLATFLAVFGGVRELTGGRLSAWLAALGVTLGAGAAWVMAPLGLLDAAPMSMGLAANEGTLVAGEKLNPTMLSYFFQHPFGLGLPVFVLVAFLVVYTQQWVGFALVALTIGIEIGAVERIEPHLGPDLE